MKRTALLLLLLLAAATHAAALEIRSYDVRLTASEDGSGAGVATVQFAGRPDASLLFPLGFAEVTNVRLTHAPAAAEVHTEGVNGQTLVRVDFPAGCPDDPSLGIEFDVKKVFVDTTPAPGEASSLPAGSRILRHALLNSQAAPIDAYRAVLLFPPSMRAHAVREALPKLSKKEAEPRVRLAGFSGRNRATLQVRRLLQGQSAVAQLEIVPRKRSVFWLLAGLALSILYLIRFRDLVARKVV